MKFAPHFCELGRNEISFRNEPSWTNIFIYWNVGMTSSTPIIAGISGTMGPFPHSKFPSMTEDEHVLWDSNQLEMMEIKSVYYFLAPTSLFFRTSPFVLKCCVCFVFCVCVVCRRASHRTIPRSQLGVRVWSWLLGCARQQIWESRTLLRSDHWSSARWCCVIIDLHIICWACNLLNWN